jgi:hypothetical protein
VNESLQALRELKRLAERLLGYERVSWKEMDAAVQRAHAALTATRTERRP